MPHPRSDDLVQNAHPLATHPIIVAVKQKIGRWIQFVGRRYILRQERRPNREVGLNNLCTRLQCGKACVNHCSTADSAWLRKENHLRNARNITTTKSS